MFSHGTYSVSSFFPYQTPGPVMYTEKDRHCARSNKWRKLWPGRCFNDWLKHWAAKNFLFFLKPWDKALLFRRHRCHLSRCSSLLLPFSSMNIHTTEPWLHKTSNKKAAKSKLIRKNRINQTYKYNKNCLTQFNAVDVLYFPKQWEWQPFWCILARYPNTYGAQMWRQKLQSVNLLPLSNRKIGY